MQKKEVSRANLNFSWSTSGCFCEINYHHTIHPSAIWIERSDHYMHLRFSIFEEKKREDSLIKFLWFISLILFCQAKCGYVPNLWSMNKFVCSFIYVSLFFIYVSCMVALTSWSLYISLVQRLTWIRSETNLDESQILL